MQDSNPANTSRMNDNDFNNSFIKVAEYDDVPITQIPEFQR